MTELLTAAQMRAIEGKAIEGGHVTGLELMERAGAAVVEAMLEQWPDLDDSPRRALVLCGPGNNGGDGFVVARLLHGRGWKVTVGLFGDPGRLPPDARRNHARWSERGPTRDIARADPLAGAGAGAESPPEVIFDAIFGTGLARPVEGRLADLLLAVEALRARGGTRVVAIDIPSGLCSDSGRNLGPETRADLTVSFHRAKLGHYLDRGPGRSGRLVVKGIGLEERAPAVPPAGIVTLASVTPGVLAKQGAAHKYGHGHALVLSGGPGRTGAARMAARGALRVGAGLVTLGVPPAAQLEVAGQVTAVMLRRVADAESLAGVLADGRLNALCLGPGLGLERARTLVPVALGAGGPDPRPTVLDADALTAHAEAPEALFAMLHDRCVLTPHAGNSRGSSPTSRHGWPSRPPPARPSPAWRRRGRPRPAPAAPSCSRGRIPWWPTRKDAPPLIPAPMTVPRHGWPRPGRATCWRGSSPGCWRAASRRCRRQ